MIVTLKVLKNYNGQRVVELEVRCSEVMAERLILALMAKGFSIFEVK